ncbi:homeodomain GLABROUS 7 [Actinidia rufa]|uniref:Homeodomain GLABROUS 7 n=1 Tax=Actinidia rufa TaxID=165716 RepID=A0A7J0GWR6_9ERIC|nr:homeodomain GLABROUS 7 [Actinidia rufa]
MKESRTTYFENLGGSCDSPCTGNPNPDFVIESIDRKPKMEGQSHVALMGGDFNPSLVARIEEDGNESDRLEGASGDDQDAAGNKHPRRKKYHRHTPYQIQELEAYFKMNNHPDEKERLELGKRLSLESKQIKFWFQNRRTQMKVSIFRFSLFMKCDLLVLSYGTEISLFNQTQTERHENNYLKRQNEELLIENIRMKEVMGNPMCCNCGGPAILGEVSIEKHHLKVKNARLKEELNRISALANRFLGRPISSFAGLVHPPMSNTSLELAVGINGFSGLSSVDTTFPIGLDSKDGILNNLPRMPLVPPPPTGIARNDIPFEKSIFLELALRAMDELVKLTQMDDPLWIRSLDGGREVLNEEEYMKICPPCIGMKPTGFVIEATRATGMVLANSLNLVETLMDANQWAEMFPCMVGRSSIIDVIFSGMAGSRNCALQLVTWVEHTEYDESITHHLYRPFLSSGMGFGAVHKDVLLPYKGNARITPMGRTGMVRLAHRMTRSYCAGVCATMNMWQLVQIGNVGEEVRLMIRKSVDKPGEPSGLVLSASTSVWMPVSHQRLFDFLRDEQLRSEWDELSHGGPMQEMAANNTNQNAMLILQETQSDASGSLIVYTAIDVAAMQVVMNGGDSASVVLLPSGFAIVPDGFPDSARPNDCNGDLIKGNGGSLLTLGFQILVNNQSPSAKLTMESVDTINSLITRTIQRIRAALHCN